MSSGVLFWILLINVILETPKFWPGEWALRTMSYKLCYGVAVDYAEVGAYRVGTLCNPHVFNAK